MINELSLNFFYKLKIKTMPPKNDLLGVPGIKAAGLLLVDLFVQAFIQFKDGVQGKDFLAFIPTVFAGAANAESFKNIGAEFKDGINPAQRVELITAFNQRFAESKLGIANEPEIKVLSGAIADALNYNLIAVQAGIALHAKRKAKPINPAEL